MANTVTLVQEAALELGDIANGLEVAAQGAPGSAYLLDVIRRVERLRAFLLSPVPAPTLDSQSALALTLSALASIASLPANSNSEPDDTGAALDQARRLASDALTSTGAEFCPLYLVASASVDGDSLDLFVKAPDATAAVAAWRRYYGAELADAADGAPRVFLAPVHAPPGAVAWEGDNGEESDFVNFDHDSRFDPGGEFDGEAD